MCIWVQKFVPSCFLYVRNGECMFQYVYCELYIRDKNRLQTDFHVLLCFGLDVEKKTLTHPELGDTKVSTTELKLEAKPNKIHL